MIMAQERSILKAQECLGQLSELVRQATNDHRRIDEVERDLWKGVQQVGLLLLEGFVAGHGSGDAGPELDHEGRTLHRLAELHDRRYVSVFGELGIDRVVYGTRETQKLEVIPLDAILNLPDSDFSYLLQEWDQSFCVQDSFAESRQSVERILGIGQSVRSLENMSSSMARDVEPFHQFHATLPMEEEGSILVLTADGKGVPMRRDSEEDAAPAKAHREKGEKANKTRQACVGGVYTIEPFVRTAEEVVDDIMRDRRKKDRPTPQNKEVRAELSRPINGEEVKGKERIFSWFKDVVKARNPNDDKDVVCVMDGDRALWKMLKGFVANVVCILDIFHVMQRLWTIGHCFYAEGSEEARAFVTDRLQRILQGDVGRVIGGMKQMATKSKLRGARLKRLNQAIKYLENNRRLMHYDEYLAKGYPIGSGVVEGACRHLVKDRMEGAGMRWKVDGAQAMLDLRAAYLNGDWEAFQTYRIEQETERLYPYRNAILELKEKDLAG